MVLLPVRSFRNGKTRLGEILAPERKQDFVRLCADRVRGAAGFLPVTVMTVDPDVAAWAVARGATALEDTGSDLNSSLAGAMEVLYRGGISRAVIAHGDLPLADDLTWLVGHDGVVIVPDRHWVGTNVLALPTGARFQLHYGHGSSAHHAAEAHRLGLVPTLVRDPLLGWDVDVPEDLGLPAGPELEELRHASLVARRAVAP